MPVAGARRSHPGPRALGRIARPPPSRGTVEPLLGLPRHWLAELVVAAPEHAALVLPLPLLLDHSGIRVEVVRECVPGTAGLTEARRDGALELGVARCKRVAQARGMRTSRQHESRRGDREPARAALAWRVQRTSSTSTKTSSRSPPLNTSCSTPAGRK